MIIDRICARINEPASAADADNAASLRAFEDIYASALAGWFEPVSIASRRYAAGHNTALIDGSLAASPEYAAFANAVAGHALDYDDVHLISVTHPSVVIVPVLAALAATGDSRRSMLDAFGVGVSVNVALGRLLGFEHYERGWHATSTIGPLAAAAAGCHLLALDERSSRSALALAAGQAGGLQRNFGSMAKPVQAGNAAAAAVRAVLLAADGVTGDSDIFGEKGVGSLYGADRKDIGTLCPSDVRSLSLKLYPCCFAAHRLIGAALDARAQLGPHADLGSIARIRLSVPFETMRPLRVTDPRTGDEARFCAAYVLATALLQGQVRFADFANEAIHRAQVRALMARITIVDDSDSGRRPAGLDSGEVHLVLEGPGMRAEAYCAVFPGSPQAPPSVEQFDAKIADCAAVYAASARVMFGLSDVRRKVRNLVGDLRSPPA